jgi:DNA-binding MarR family transcriptional regulator
MYIRPYIHIAPPSFLICRRCFSCSHFYLSKKIENLILQIIKKLKMKVKTESSGYSTQILERENVSTEKEYVLLEFLDNHEGLSIHQISKVFGWDHELIGYYVSRLEEKNLVKMVVGESGGDERKVYINRASKIKDMLNPDEIDQRVFEEFDV